MMTTMIPTEPDTHLIYDVRPCKNRGYDTAGEYLAAASIFLHDREPYDERWHGAAIKRKSQQANSNWEDGQSDDATEPSLADGR